MRVAGASASVDDGADGSGKVTRRGYSRSHSAAGMPLSQRDPRKLRQGWSLRFPFFRGLSVRTRSLALLSLAAMSALVLAGCTSAPSADSDASPSPTTADLCSAQVASGEASDSVKIEGDVGTESTATFTSPLDVSELQSTQAEKGSGDALESGDLVQFA